MRIAGQELHGLFGMSEMETAAKLILRRGEDDSGTLRNLPWIHFHPEEFHDPADPHLLIGFCQLLARGFVRPTYPNSEFVVTQAFLDRINGRFGCVLESPTRAQWLERMFAPPPKAG